jgi:amino acid transporter
MEFTDLQAIWLRYDESLSENTKINKEILKKILIAKPEKRINWEKIKASVNLTLPIALILLILVPNIHFRSSIDFYIGSFMFGAVFAFIYYWSVRYYLLINKIDFSNSITLIKRNIKQVEKYKIKINRLGYTLMPFGIIGVFIMGDFPFFSRESILPIFLIVLVMILSMYFTFKYSVFEQFRKLDREIDELEKLETE